jgi:hypothetical protein
VHYDAKRLRILNCRGNILTGGVSAVGLGEAS